MVLFNYATREITGKIVYYGPGLCGKTTNLQVIHQKLDPKTRGKMLSLATDTDRTLFFDFLPLKVGKIRGMNVRFQLYTVPGQVFYNETRKLVLKGADAVVFVADSQEAMLDANIDAYQNLKDNLRLNGIDPDNIPLVMQYNKRDLDDTLPVGELDKRLNERSVPCFESIATEGVGVLETFREIGKLLMQSLSEKHKLKKVAADESEGAAEESPAPAAGAAAAAGESAASDEAGAASAPAAQSPAAEQAEELRKVPSSFTREDVEVEEIDVDVEEDEDETAEPVPAKAAPRPTPKPTSKPAPKAAPKKAPAGKSAEVERILLNQAEILSLLRDTRRELAAFKSEIDARFNTLREYIDGRIPPVLDTRSSRKIFDLERSSDS